MLAAK